MTSRAKWADRLPLNERGFGILCAALLLSARWNLREEEQSCREYATLDRVPGSWLALCPMPENLPFYRERVRLLTETLRLFRLDFCDLLAARRVKIGSFRYEWYHLLDRQFLLLSLKDSLPEWALGSFAPHPIKIARVSGFDVIDQLQDLVVWGARPENRSKPVFAETEEELLFMLSVSDLCETPKRGGRPKGIADGKEEAIAHAVRLVIKEGKSARDATRIAISQIGFHQKRAGVSDDLSKVCAFSPTAAFQSVYASVLKSLKNYDKVDGGAEL